MTDVEIAWVVGLFEGEGTFSFSNTTGNFVGISLGITSTDKDVLEKFLRIVGVGKIYKKKKRMPHHKDQWFWSVANKLEVKPLIEAMIPHLGERRTIRAYEALEHCKYLRHNQREILICSMDDCNDKNKAKGLCKYHYDRQRYNRVRINKRPTKTTE